MERQAGVYFILTGNPFGVAAEAALKLESEDEVPRIIKNQIAIRGAKIAGRGLTAMGATALAGSAALARKPLRQGRFSVVDKKTYRQRLREGSVKPEHRGQKVTRFKRNVRVYGQIDVQERRARARPGRRRRQRVTALRGAGTIATIGGQLVPMLAFGYVASSYIDLHAKQPLQTEKVVEDAAWINTQIVGDIYTAIRLVDVGSTVASGIIGTIKESF